MKVTLLMLCWFVAAVTCSSEHEDEDEYECDESANDPTCGENGIVYENRCFLESGVEEDETFQACRGEHYLCPSEDQCEPLPTPDELFVCAADGRVYASECYMHYLNCGSRMKLKPLTYCDSSEDRSDIIHI